MLSEEFFFVPATEFHLNSAMLSRAGKRLPQFEFSWLIRQNLGHIDERPENLSIQLHRTTVSSES
jgi:hypothetical protein